MFISRVLLLYIYLFIYYFYFTIVISVVLLLLVCKYSACEYVYRYLRFTSWLQLQLQLVFKRQNPLVLWISWSLIKERDLWTRKSSALFRERSFSDVRQIGHGIFLSVKAFNSTRGKSLDRKSNIRKSTRVSHACVLPYLAHVRYKKLHVSPAHLLGRRG